MGTTNKKILTQYGKAYRSSSMNAILDLEEKTKLDFNFQLQNINDFVNEIILCNNESFLVDGNIPHSIWNNTNSTTKMIEISIK